MQINSSNFTQKDLEYFKDNFKLGESNVSSIEEAEIIFLGENHSNNLHEAKNLWLVSKCAKYGDMLFVESTKDPISFNGAPYFLELRGWDSEAVRLQMDRRYAKIAHGTDLLEKCDPEVDTPAKVAAVVQKTSKLISMNAMQATVSKIKALNFPLSEPFGPIHEMISVSKNTFEAFSQIVEFSSKEYLKENFPIYCKQILNLWSMYLSFALVTTSLKRDAELAQKVTQECGKGKRIFVFAGKSHLGWKSESHAESKKRFELLKEQLHGKKFVVLFPNKKTNDLDVITKSNDETLKATQSHQNHKIIMLTGLLALNAILLLGALTLKDKSPLLSTSLFMGVSLTNFCSNIKKAIFDLKNQKHKVLYSWQQVGPLMDRIDRLKTKDRASRAK